MAKRKEPDTPTKVNSTPTKRRRGPVETPTKSSTKIPRGTPLHDQTDLVSDGEGSPTPRGQGAAPFETPKKSKKLEITRSKTIETVDRSAKRKSAAVLTSSTTQGNQHDWDHSTELATEILEDNREVRAVDTIEVASTVADTPSKRGRGRPKGAKNKRSPTPEGDLPPEERYFFQNRTGPVEISNNSFSATGLLTHDEFFDQLRSATDIHQREVAFLTKLHTRSFQQWHFELKQGYSLCVYGWGSKRLLLDTFAKWIQSKLTPRTSTVILNGYNSKINIRTVFNTIFKALSEGVSARKLIGQPADMIDTLVTHMENVDARLLFIINSIDGPSLRKPAIQSLLSMLAANQRVNLIASADSPNFQLLWNSTTRARFNFVFHDATTFAPYVMETSTIDDVNELLGRKGKRTGGKEGIGFVLKSLPENARNLYRVLLTEILTILTDGTAFEDDEDFEDVDKNRLAGRGSTSDIGVEYRLLYQKASEEFICSSDMNFRFLLKEFHDHQILNSRRDPSGVEILSVPLAKDEMEAVLEDLVVG